MLRRWVIFRAGEYLTPNYDWTTDNDVSKAKFFSTPEDATVIANPIRAIVLTVDINLHGPKATEGEKQTNDE